MWESPIQMISDDIIKDLVQKQDELLMESVHRVGVNIDKDELVKALNYDRDQYEKGYADGRRARDSEIVRCKDCIHCDCSIDGMGFFYCDFDEGRTVSPNGFCDVAERRNGDRG